MLHDQSLNSHDVFEWLLTMLLPEVDLDFAIVDPMGFELVDGHDTIERDTQQAERLGRKVKILRDRPKTGPDIVAIAQHEKYDLIIVPRAAEAENADSDWVAYVLQNSPCIVFLASHPALPKHAVA
jgi:hypothetical protein